MKLGCFIFKKQHLPLHTDIQQQQIKLEETKQNRKKSLTCFSQTCICKHQEFYLLDQMAQAHWSHTFLVLFEDTEWALTSHLPLLFRSGTKGLRLSQLPFQSVSVRVVRRTQAQKGANQGVLPHSCALHRICSWAVVQKELKQFLISGSEAFRHCCIHPALSGWLCSWRLFDIHNLFSID